MDREPSAHQLDGADSEWQYRGRSNSEQAELGPIPAPSGLPAQKNEGFQRFYKAVVSPTHVRVTAGGRIVPNTRGCSSPTGKWNRDKVVTESNSIRQDQTLRTPFPSGLAFQLQNYSALPPMFHSFPTAISPGLPQDGMFTWTGWPFGFGVCAPFPSPMVPASTDGPATTRSHSINGEMASGTRKVRCHSLQTGRLDMHPCHGMVLPVVDSRMGPSLSKEQSSRPQTLATPNIAQVKLPERQADTKQVESVSSTVTNSANSAKSNSVLPENDHLASTKSPAPPISSIRPSQITRKQIDVLRSSLRYLEDQLQYNKHQIDEKLIEHQAKMVRQQIQQFEQNLETQRLFEESHYPKEDKLRNTTSSSDLGAVPVASNKAGHASERSMLDVTTSVRSRNSDLVDSSTTQKTAQHTRSSSQKNDSVNQKEENDNRALPAVRKYSTLPFKAAMAPPFRPQAELGGQDIGQDFYNEKVKKGRDKGFQQNHLPGQLNYQQSMLPYFVGHMPSHFTPHTLPPYHYKYDRELTIDELKARHMYWGNSPNIFPPMLANFDGKDNYSWCKHMADVQGYPSSEDDIKPGDFTAKQDVTPVDSFKRPRHRANIAHLDAKTQSESLPARDSSATDASTFPSPRADSCIASVINLSAEGDMIDKVRSGEGLTTEDLNVSTTVPNIRRKSAVIR